MGKPAALVLTCLMFASPAAMASLYRCVGVDGIPNYSSKRVNNAVCKALSTGTGASRVSSSSASKPAPARPADPVAVATAAVEPGASPAGATKQVVFSTSPAAAPARAVNAGGATRVLRGAVSRFERDGVTPYTHVRPHVPLAPAPTLVEAVDEHHFLTAVVHGQCEEPARHTKHQRRQEEDPSPPGDAPPGATGAGQAIRTARLRGIDTE